MRISLESGSNLAYSATQMRTSSISAFVRMLGSSGTACFDNVQIPLIIAVSMVTQSISAQWPEIVHAMEVYVCDTYTNIAYR